MQTIRKLPFGGRLFRRARRRGGGADRRKRRGKKHGDQEHSGRRTPGRRGDSVRRKEDRGAVQIGQAENRLCPGRRRASGRTQPEHARQSDVRRL